VEVVFSRATDHIGLLAEQDSITNVSRGVLGKGAGIRVFREERDGFGPPQSTSSGAADGGPWSRPSQWLAWSAGQQRLQPLSIGAHLQACAITARANRPWVGQLPRLGRRPPAGVLEGTALLERHGHTCSPPGSYAPRLAGGEWWPPVNGTVRPRHPLHQSVGFKCTAADGRATGPSQGGGLWQQRSPPMTLRLVGPQRFGRRDLRPAPQAMLRAELRRSRQLPGGAGNRFGVWIFHEACGHLLENHPGGAGHHHLR